MNNIKNINLEKFSDSRYSTSFQGWIGIKDGQRKKSFEDGETAWC